MKWLELKIPPPVIFLACAGAMELAASHCPWAAIPVPFRKILTMFPVLLGGALGAAGIWTFLKARTTIHPNRPEHSAALVTTGLYRISRNPMYLGLLLILAGWAIFLANLAAFGFLPAFVFVMNRLQILPEERILRGKFGPGYDAYCRTVRRWI